MDRDVEAAFAPQASPKLDGFLQQRPRASVPRLLVASMPRMITTMAVNAQVIALLFSDTTSISTTVIRVLGPLMSLIFSPIVGALSDRSTNSSGRRRPYLIFSTLAIVLVLFLSCFHFDIANAFGYDSLPYVAVIFHLFTAVLVNFVDTPTMLLVSDLAGDRQITGAALGQGWAILGSVFVADYFQLFGDITSSGSFVAVCCVLMLIIVTIVGCCITETPREPSDATPQVVAATTGVSSSALTVYAWVALFIGYGLYTFNSNRLQFFEERVVSDSDDDYYYYYSSGSSLAEFKYFIIQQIFAYIFMWTMPFLTNKIGANSVLSLSLVPQALLIIMAFAQSKTLVGIMDFLVAVFCGTLMALVVPAVYHVYGANKHIGARVGFLTSVGSVGQLVAIAIGNGVLETDLTSQLPLLLAGIMAVLALCLSGCMMPLQLKSL